MLPNDSNDDANGFSLPSRKDKVLQPLHKLDTEKDDPAVNIIRQKINALYAHEPAAKEELAEVKAIPKHRSKHQQFMYDLSRSGKSLADIQTTWHNYYVNLPDDEKHQVWQEFYANHRRMEKEQATTAAVLHEPPKASPPPHAVSHKKKRIRDARSVSDVKKQLLGTVDSRARQNQAHRGKSLLFGFGLGTLVVVIMLFGFFNERFIAPFITPSRTVSSTPIILDTSAAVSSEPKLIIPKINVEVPVVYDEPSIDEDAVQKALEKGVLHYATTSNPGERGNAVIFGHSSNNILNRGQFKFAFVMLNRLEKGDTFMVHFEKQRYIYRIVEKKIVKPDEVSVLGPVPGRAATVTLITCDPPGTAINRLLVIGEQISPDPASNIASTASGGDTTQPATLPSNAPSLWSRFWGWLSS